MYASTRLLLKLQRFSPRFLYVLRPTGHVRGAGRNEMTLLVMTLEIMIEKEISVAREKSHQPSVKNDANKFVICRSSNFR